MVFMKMRLIVLGVLDKGKLLKGVFEKFVTGGIIVKWLGKVVRDVDFVFRSFLGSYIFFLFKEISCALWLWLMYFEGFL